jgi:hypothetical protein
MSNSTKHPLSRALAKTPEGPMRAPARALGWFSIGLGVAELVMPRALARAAGMPNVPTLTRLYGLREIGVGIGLLASKDPAPWLWARVAGDALDMATVGAGLVTAGKPVRTLATLATLGSIAYIDMQTAQGAKPKAEVLGSSPYDYSSRSGFPKPVSEMRGVAANSKPSTPMIPGRLGTPAFEDRSETAATEITGNS